MFKGLFTDKYELTMLDAAFADGTYNTKCVFEVYAKRIAGARPFAVVCGGFRFLEELANFRFSAADIEYISSFMKEPAAVEFLTNYQFTGSIMGYADGEIYYPDSPVLTIEGTFAECVLLETLVLSILNYDSAVATATTRMVHYANGKPCLEMGSRRTHEAAALAAARAAVLCGCAGTSNLYAGRLYNLPTIGTAAHAWTLVHNNESEAFASQIANLGTSTTLLVDTYDVVEGVKNAIKVAGKNLGSVRIDSGDLLNESKKVRRLLDELGAVDTKIVATSDIDEYKLAELKDAPIDSYGIGTKLVTGSGVPTAEFVYKLVAKNGEPVGKRSEGKTTIPGKKYAYRELNNAGIATREHLFNQQPQESKTNLRPLQISYVAQGVVNADLIGVEGLKVGQAAHQQALSELPEMAWTLKGNNAPCIPTVVSPCTSQMSP